VRRYELRIVAKRVDAILNPKNHISIEKARDEVLSGVKFVSKEGRLKIAVFNPAGELLFSSHRYIGETFQKRDYPSEKKHFISTEQWKSWRKWDTDIYYTGENCHVKLNDTQQIEIEDDISLFFFASLPAVAILSLIGGGVLSSAATRRLRRVERAVAAIAEGDLGYRIPETASNDEMAVMERNMNRMFSELETSFTRIMEFSSDLAHELRTPLTVMTGELEVALREARSQEEYQQVLANMMEEVAGLQRLVDDMLILLKPNAAYASGNFKKLDFSLLVDNVMESLDLLADSKSVKTRCDIQKGVHIYGNPSLLKMLLSNLIHNAIKYTAPNGEVSVSLAENAKTTILTVTDNGQGIPPEEQSNVFKRFYRMRSDGKNKNFGTGLGLAIVKKVCEVHDAEITLESSNEGSTFTVTWTKE
jgi:signal transduction histidine kinase